MTTQKLIVSYAPKPFHYLLRTDLHWQTIPKGKHNQALTDRKKFYEPKSSKQGGSGSSTNANTECETSNIKQPTVEVLVEKAQVQNTEIVWLLKLITSGFSNKSCEELSETLRCMFSDSHIVKGFKVSRTKAQYTVNPGIAPYFKTLLKTNIDI